jgi:hypothetical protein
MPESQLFVFRSADLNSMFSTLNFDLRSDPYSRQTFNLLLSFIKVNRWCRFCWFSWSHLTYNKGRLSFKSMGLLLQMYRKEHLLSFGCQQQILACQGLQVSDNLRVCYYRNGLSAKSSHMPVYVILIPVFSAKLWSRVDIACLWFHWRRWRLETLRMN